MLISNYIVIVSYEQAQHSGRSKIFVPYPDSLRSLVDVNPKMKKYNGQTTGLRARALMMK